MVHHSVQKNVITGGDEHEFCLRGFETRTKIKNTENAQRCKQVMGIMIIIKQVIDPFFASVADAYVVDDTSEFV